MISIYALTDADDNVRYVGKAISPRKRLQSHLRDNSERRVNRWLRSLSSAPKIKILEEVTGDWREAERRWIAFYRNAGADLCNHTDGGDGVSGVDAEGRARLSVAMKNRFKDPVFRMKFFTKERAKRISAALTGKAKNREHVAKLPQNRAGRKVSPTHADFLRRVNIGRKMPMHLRDKLIQRNIGNNYALGNQHTKGRVMPEHEKEIRSRALIGRPKTAEHREKLRLGAVRRWQRQHNQEQRT